MKKMIDLLKKVWSIAKENIKRSEEGEYTFIGDSDSTATDYNEWDVFRESFNVWRVENKIELIIHQLV